MPIILQPVIPPAPPMQPAPGVGGRVNISASTVIAGIKTTLDDYLHGFVAEQERLEGRAAQTLPVPGDVVTGQDRAVIRPEDSFPVVYVISPGLTEVDRHGLWTHDLHFGVVVGVFLMDDDRDDTHEFLRSYVAAIRFCLLHKGVYGVDCTIDFNDEAYDVIGGERIRSLAGGEIGLNVIVENAIVIGEDPYPYGPPVDPYDPLADPPVVLTTDIDIEQDEIT